MQPVPGHACLIISEVQDLLKMTETILPKRTYEVWPKEEKQLLVSQCTSLRGYIMKDIHINFKIQMKSIESSY